MAEVTTLDPETLTSPATPEAVAEPAVPAEPVDPDAPAVEPGNEPSDDSEDSEDSEDSDEPEERTLDDIEEDFDNDVPLPPSEFKLYQQELARREAAINQQREVANLLPNTANALAAKINELFGVTDERDKLLVKNTIDQMMLAGPNSAAAQLNAALVQPHVQEMAARLIGKLVESGMKNREAKALIYGDGTQPGTDFYEYIDKAYEAGKRNGVSDKEVAKREKAAADARERELFAKYPDRFPAKPEDSQRTSPSGSLAAYEKKLASSEGLTDSEWTAYMRLRSDSGLATAASR